MMYSDLVSTELIFFIKQLPYSYYKKIPTSLIENLYKNYSEDIYKKMDDRKLFYECDLCDETKSLINDIAVNCFDIEDYYEQFTS